MSSFLVSKISFNRWKIKLYQGSLIFLFLFTGCYAPETAVLLGDMEIVEEEVCGDGIQTTREQCDDGNTFSGDGCSSSCVLELEMNFCGDGSVSNGEECDDGNTLSGDGCSDQCTVEGSWGGQSMGGTMLGGEMGGNDLGGMIMGGEMGGDDQGGQNIGGQIGGTPTAGECGDGVVDFGEACDDGNTLSGDGCSSVCLTEDSACGDGVIDFGE